MGDHKRPLWVVGADGRVMEIERDRRGSVANRGKTRSTSSKCGVIEIANSARLMRESTDLDRFVTLTVKVLV